MGEQCDHPADRVKVTETKAATDEGNPPPQFWTIEGECECGAVVEIDYTFHTISEV